MKPTRFFCVLFTALCIQAAAQDKRQADFSPFSAPWSIESLQKKISKQMVADARADMNALNLVNRQGTYKPFTDSLDKHRVPQWYADAKLGIFFDWGLYSIAGYGAKGWSRARYPDWYLSHMYTQCAEYHKKTWGENFHRDDFIPLFTAENFDANAVVQLAKEAGARYFVPFSKHHDGFCLWDSKYTRRDAVDMSPHRDLSREMVEACNKAGLKHGFYFSVEDYEYPIIDADNKLKIRYWSKSMAPDNAGLAEENQEVYAPFNSALHNRMVSGKVPVNNFIDEYLVPQAKDYIDKYQPDILWFDGEWQRPAEYYKTPDIVAYFYNTIGQTKEVVANDRLGKGTRGLHGDFYTSETDEVTDAMTEVWEENRSMSESYGYNHTDSLSNYLTPNDLIEMFVRIVAKGGNLNLIVNPDGTGHVPQIQIDLLRELGAWLSVNGEAIYGTQPYEVTCDNTQLGQPVWYTRSRDGKYGYAIVFHWPLSETFICKGANMIWDTPVYMLGWDKPLEWVDTGKKHWGMSARIPDEMLHNPALRPCRHAWVLRFEWDRENRF